MESVSSKIKNGGSNNTSFEFPWPLKAKWKNGRLKYWVFAPTYAGTGIQV